MRTSTRSNMDCSVIRSYTAMPGNSTSPSTIPCEALKTPTTLLPGWQSARGGDRVYFDTAYFDGAWYCYFGVIPALLLFCPYELVTGEILNTSLATLVFGIAVILSAALLTASALRRYFHDKATTVHAVLFFLMMVLGSRVCYLAFAGRFYSIPTETSLLLTFVGLSLWLTARKPHSADLSKPKLFVGTLLMMMNIGARPQFLFGCLLAFPIFWNEIVHDRVLFSKKGLFNTALVFMAIACVVIPIGIYNQARFGNPLDFGADYNMAVFDMVNYSQRKLLTLKLVYYLLLQPPALCSSFPFVNVSVTLQDFDQLGWAPLEAMYGGVIWIVPYTLLCIPAAICSYKHKEVPIRSITCIALVGTVLVAAFDVSQAGINLRYTADVSWILSLAGALSYVNIAQTAEKRKRAGANGAAITFACASALFSILILFSPDIAESIQLTNPTLWEAIVAWFS